MIATTDRNRVAVRSVTPVVTLSPNAHKSAAMAGREATCIQISTAT